MASNSAFGYTKGTADAAALGPRRTGPRANGIRLPHEVAAAGQTEAVAKQLQSRLYVSSGMQLVPHPPAEASPERVATADSLRPVSSGRSLQRSISGSHYVTSMAAGYQNPARNTRPVGPPREQNILSMSAPPGIGRRGRELTPLPGAQTQDFRFNPNQKLSGVRGQTAEAEQDLEEEDDGEHSENPLAPVDRTDPLWFIDRIRRNPESLEFVYLTWIEKGSPHFNPYHLRIVQHKEIDPDDYYTLSSKGITHFVNNAAEFVPLDQWLREYNLYGAIKEIPMFQMYRMWKAYVVWKAATRSRKSTLCRTALHSTLFIAQVDHGFYLRKVRSLCYDLGEERLFVVSPSETLTLDEFLARQAEHKEVITRRLETFVAAVKSIVAEACETSLAKAGADEENGVDDGRFGRGGGGSQISYTFMAAKRTECRRLANLIKLADYLIVNTVHQLAVNSVRELVHAINPPPPPKAPTPPPVDEDAVLAQQVQQMNETRDVVAEQRRQALAAVVGDADKNAEKVPMFRIELKLNRDSLEFAPDAREFEERLTGDHGLIKDFEKLLIVKVEKLITNAQFLQRYVSPTLNDHLEVSEVGEGPVLNDIMETDTSYEQLIGRIKDGLAGAFTDCRRFAKKFEPWWHMYIENEMMDIEQIRKLEPDLDFFRKAMKKYRVQKEDMETIPVSSDVGIINIDSTLLKSKFVPSPQRCLQDIENLLPQLAKAKNEDLLARLNNAILRLSALPQSVGEFVAKLSFLTELNEAQDAIQAQFDLVKDMYKLIEEYQPHIGNMEEYATYRTLQNKVVQMKAKMAFAEDAKDKDVASFSGVLDKDIAKLRNQIMDVRRRGQAQALLSDNDNVQQVLFTINGLNDEIIRYRDAATESQNYQTVFKLPIAKFDELDLTIDDLELKKSLWQSLYDWDVLRAHWNEQQFMAINAEEMSAKVAYYAKVCYRLEQKLPANNVVPRLRSMIDDFKVFLPIVLDLRNESLRPRHLERIKEVTGHRMNLHDEKFTLGTLLEMDAIEHKEKIAEISLEATNEKTLEDMLKKVEGMWVGADFVVVNYKDSKDMFYLDKVDDILGMLEESQIMIGTILGSRYVGPIKPQADQWDRDLSLFRNTMREWVKVQLSWMYLESIFNSPDIVKALPDEDKLFRTADREWRGVMRKTKDKPNALKVILQPDLLDKFLNMSSILDRVQQSINVYLEKKRMAFPRFYFLSDDELLKILSQTRNPLSVQPHLIKCFDNIHALDFISPEGAGKALEIVAMRSDKERVVFSKSIKPRDAVEVWLTRVEEEMRGTLRKRAKDLLEHATKEREYWMFDHPAQLVLAVSQILWVRDVELAFSAPNVNNSLIQLRNKCRKNVTDLAKMVRGQLEKLQRSILAALMTADVHNRDVVEEMIALRVPNASDFNWQKQLRYYWDTNEDNIFLSQTNSRLKYCYEYLGCPDRLVLTPLTDRCYITLTGAMQLQLGGSPAGPAGTGKTETVKDLSKAVAVQCVVFNCSEQMTAGMMGEFFSGLAATGAWCCFDEFNRIEIEVLSVIATQILQIKNAKVAQYGEFEFEGRKLRLNMNCAYFVTMNPGYRGRSELPDNLKALFRPVAMMIPDYAMIAEIILLSEGFESAKKLSRKMTQMYKLASEQLSQQKHYDFGLRAVKSVLVMAGSLKRASEHLPEDIVLIRALRDSNMPKFLAEDIPLFQNILNDLFPGIHLPDQDYGDLQVAVEKAMTASGLQVVPAQVHKVIQLYETTLVRHGMMLIGPTGGGKTTVYQMLQAALTSLRKGQPDHPNVTFQNVKTFVINPKAITKTELYGAVNKNTKEYLPGIIANVVETCVTDSSDTLNWIIFDGPVDATWVEDMNSVLDDSKVLCLPNSARIKFTPRMRMMFEVADLAKASLATVSRCGMVYMEPVDLGWMCYVQSWLARVTLPAHVEALILTLMTNLVDRGLTFVRRECHEDMPTTDLQLVMTLCSLLESLVSTRNGVNFQMPEDDMTKLVEDLFMFSYIWSIGGNLDKDSREKFDRFIQEAFKDITALPGQRSVYNYFVDMKHHSFRLWDDVLPDFKYSPNVPYSQMLVPTVDTVAYQYMLETLLAVNKPVLINGVTGVGKTAIVADWLRRNAEPQNFVAITMNMSAQTSSPRTQEMIEVNLEKRGKREALGGPGGRRVVLYVDDINMPALDESGSQPPIELLRQFLDFGGFYDRPALFWKDIQDLTLIASCAPPGGGRNPLTSRITRHFALMSIPPTSNETLVQIFGTILQGFLSQFPPDVRTLARQTTSACVELYQRVAKELRPTPTTSHYTFNLRDLSKVVQGVLQARVGYLNTSDGLMRLWCHENLRVFHDRLTNPKDRETITDILVELTRRHFSMQIDRDEFFVKSPPVYGNFMRVGAQAHERVYEDILDKTRMQSVLEEYLDRFNMEATNEVKLVLFKDAVDHLARICRILEQPRGNALLVGVGGTGKRSLTRLAAFMCEYRVYEIKLTRVYGSAEFRDDLRAMFRLAGVTNVPVVFLLSDTQLVSESFLEDVSNILNSGDVPALFEGEEYEKVVIDARQGALDAGVGSNREEVYRHFIHKVRENLHIVLCMSPVGDFFRARCRMFPSLVNCCTINWFDEWSPEALRLVAERKLKDLDLGGTAGIVQRMAAVCVQVHTSVAACAEKFFQELRRRFYITPTSYLEFLAVFQSTLTKKRKEVLAARDRYVNGVQSLKDTNQLVVVMEAKLQQLKPELEKKAVATEALMKQVAVESEDADQMRNVVSREEAEVAEQTLQSKIAYEDAERDLREVAPELEAALSAVDVLRPQHIAEVRNYITPPTPVQDAMTAVLMLLGYTNPTWDQSKRVLGDAHFLKSLREYDKDNVKPATVLAVQNAYVNNPEIDFTREAYLSVSTACSSLVMWVRAICMYSDVYRRVAPKRELRDQAQGVLKEMTIKLESKRATLAQVENKLAELQAQYEAAVASKLEVQETIEVTSRQLDRAGKLTTLLADEAVRWREQIETLDNRMTTLVGDMFLASAAVAYHGAFTAPYRADLTAKWLTACRQQTIAFSEGYSLVGSLGDPVVTRQWQIQGLPTDDFSTENAVFVASTLRWPLMIDPQGQANRWIRNLERSNGLKILKPNDKDLMRSLEQAIRLGTPVLLEDVGTTLDPSLDPLLLKQTFKQGQRTLLRLSDAEFDYDPNFRLYITTKLANPHYLPDVCIKVTVINFTVTVAGLDDQLLGVVVRKEVPELEEQRVQLIASLADDKAKLQQFEDKILQLLYNSEGILDDDTLINTLKDTKVRATQIKERVKETEETEKKVNVARNQYRPVSVRGSIVYFVMVDLASVDPMYQYSLDYFIRLFNKVIDVSAKSNVLATRLETLINAITLSTYENVSRGLFARHKILFSFLITVQVLLNKATITDVEWNAFLRAGSLVDRATQAARPQATWLTARMWDMVTEVSRDIPTFSSLASGFNADIGPWERYFNSVDPWKESLPTTWQTRVSPFQRLILVKIFRPEKVVTACSEFVATSLGRAFTENLPFHLSDVYADTSPAVPIIFVLSAGADPAAALMRFAEEAGMTGRFQTQSLGQGQGPKAERYIQQGMKNGEWIFLQNCHVAQSWMPELERIVKEFAGNDATIHKDFRLWLSSMPSADFPITVLQTSSKITEEPPKGIRRSMTRTLSEISETEFELCTKPEPWKKLQFGLALFHALVIERKKFGPIGWNIQYDFGSSDLDISRKMLRILLQENNEVPFDALQYMTGDIAYGGRVTDDWDRRCLKTMLSKFYNPSALGTTYKFSPSGVYALPASNDYNGYRTYVEQLPFSDPPEIFGLHENANIQSEQQESDRMLGIIVTLQPRRVTAEGGQTNEQIVLDMAAALFARVPPNINVEEGDARLFATDAQGRINSLSTVLKQEIVRFNDLLNVVRSTLREIQEAINGFTVMSSELEKMYHSLLDNRVPELWVEVSFLSLRPLGSWFEDLIERVRELKKWLLGGQPPCFWISGLFYPQGFLTAVLQNHARKYNVAVDALSFSFTVLDHDHTTIEKGPTDGVYVRGLFLDGARWNWDRKQLEEAQPKQLYSAMPVIHFLPRENYARPAAEYACPLYKTTTRAGTLRTTGESTNFVLTVDLKTAQPVDHWILRGVALVSQLND